MAQYEFHPWANTFPMLDEDELRELADDIARHGLRHPILLADGKIADGRNRYRACQIAGVEPRFAQWDGNGSLLDAIVSDNLKRRHLDAAQRAMVAARLKPIYEEEARKRQGTRTDLSANLRLGEAGKAAEKAAAALNVSPRSVESAAAVLRDGADELVKAVEYGKVAVSTAAIVAQLPKEEQQVVVAKGEKEILKAAAEIRGRKREERREERVERLANIARGASPLESVAERFPVIYADPPWSYEHCESDSRDLANQYPTMELDAIKALPLERIVTSDAVLFLWATSPKLAEAMGVIEAWGFDYRTSMVWVKDRIGMGYYARQQHELLLIATKGTPPTPAPSDRPPSVVTAPRLEHSAKPNEFRKLIEQMYPTLPRIELFARERDEGWQAWGNQA